MGFFSVFLVLYTLVETAITVEKLSPMQFSLVAHPLVIVLCCFPCPDTETAGNRSKVTFRHPGCLGETL
jgi:hypothetical protein